MEEYLERALKIARLRVSPEERDALLHDARRILEMFEVVSSVEEESADDLPVGAPRDDVPRKSEEADGIVDAFPEKKERLLKVPRNL